MTRLLLMAIAILTLLACARRPVTPTRESRRAIDTMFTQQVMQLQPAMDSFCAKYGDSIYQVAIDSMLRERMAEMQELVQ
jgi:hypothetical protein